MQFPQVLKFAGLRRPSQISPKNAEHGSYVRASVSFLFQWAAVASQLVLGPPEDFDYDGETCIKHLLEPSADSRGQDPLDDLYRDEEVLG